MLEETTLEKAGKNYGLMKIMALRFSLAARNASGEQEINKHRETQGYLQGMKYLLKVIG